MMPDESFVKHLRQAIINAQGAGACTYKHPRAGGGSDPVCVAAQFVYDCDSSALDRLRESQGIMSVDNNKVLLDIGLGDLSQRNLLSWMQNEWDNMTRTLALRRECEKLGTISIAEVRWIMHLELDDWEKKHTETK